MEVGERLAASIVPVKDAVRAVADALSVMLNVAVAVPVEVGEKTTVTVQEPPFALRVEQLLVWVNSVPKVPGTSVTSVTLTEEAVPFETVKV